MQSKGKKHNKEARWLQELKQENANIEQDKLIITKRKVERMAKKMKNWKAPGKDEVHGYSIKYLTTLHPRIAQQFQMLLESR